MLKMVMFRGRYVSVMSDLYFLCKWNALCSQRLCCNLCDRETDCESHQKLRVFFLEYLFMCLRERVVCLRRILLLLVLSI
jgi:hypothetical protein